MYERMVNQEESTEFDDNNDVGFALYGNARLNSRGIGVWGDCPGGDPIQNTPVGVLGRNLGLPSIGGNSGIGVLGIGGNGHGVKATNDSDSYPTLYAKNNGKNSAVYANNDAVDHPAVYGKNKDGIGVLGDSDNSNGMYGKSIAPDFPAVWQERPQCWRVW
jgi:hypothetical protein